jgi:hypothetical protein
MTHAEFVSNLVGILWMTAPALILIGGLAIDYLRTHKPPRY